MKYELFKDFISSKDSSDDRIFLLEKVSEQCGFFEFNNRLCFVVKTSESKNDSVSTNYVEFVPNMEINSVTNDPSFEKGVYDFLILKEQDDDEIITSFIQLCELYGRNPTISFNDFISSIIDLFQLPRKQSYLDSIGLLGELILIYKFFEMRIDVSSYWHLSGPFSKYDFSLPNFNIEVKSSITDSASFKIKHAQLFNNENNIVALMSLRKTDSSGFSLEQLIHFFKNTKPFSQNLRFLIALEKELQKQIEPDMFKNRFDLFGIFFFDSKKIPTISGIPFNISEISYSYDFDLSESINIDDFIQHYLRELV